MEEEKQTKEKEVPRIKRKTSLFKKRRKAEIRPFVREAKIKKASRMVQFIFLFVILIFILTAIVYSVKEYVLPRIFNGSTTIISPQGSSFLTQDKFQDILQERNVEASDIKFTDSLITFLYKQKILVLMSPKKDVNQQLNLIEAIDKQVKLDGKQAISIDLRYNKPIVKF